VASTQFMVSVKSNSADFQRGGFDSDDSLTVARALETEGIDLLEISGGTLENTAMLSGVPQRESTRAREAYFREFAERISQEVSVPLMLTGGFRTRQGMNDVVDSGAVDVVGLARPITYEPDLPQRLLDGTAEKSLLSLKSLGHRTFDDLVNSVWHQQQLARLGRGRAVRPSRGPVTALVIALLTNARDLLLPQLAALLRSSQTSERSRVRACCSADVVLASPVRRLSGTSYLVAMASSGTQMSYVKKCTESSPQNWDSTTRHQFRHLPRAGRMGSCRRHGALAVWAAPQLGSRTSPPVGRPSTG
jgi:hypothetical protein